MLLQKEKTSRGGSHTSIGDSTAEAQVLPADRQAALLPVNPVQLAYAGTQSVVSAKSQSASRWTVVNVQRYECSEADSSLAALVLTKNHVLVNKGMHIQADLMMI